ncbi:hypothetical protein [uncultured Methanobrevibacter sp.]|uniref:hypothetical protein n=1 Tax=uncultured Methanobrevibacter sp. TaxID=253161 RepID=UPI0025DDAF92|nr:hypothetical protein [uncultured Methanobrevibacter sp.]
MGIFSKTTSFKDFEDIILRGDVEINLDNDVVLNTGIFSKEKYGVHGGIKLETDNLVIDGCGHVIDAKQKSQILNIANGKHVTLKNIIFKNARRDEKGGAIYAGWGSEVEIIDCEFIDESHENPAMHNMEASVIHNFGNMMIMNASFDNISTDISNNSHGTVSLDKVTFVNAGSIRNYGKLFADENINAEITPEGEFHIQTANEFDFNYLNELIRTQSDEIKLEHDISPSASENRAMKIDIDNVTIDGCGHAIDGMDKTGIFEISGKNIIFKNIIFKNGSPLKGKGTIINEGETEIIGCTILNNNAKAIENMGQLRLKRCKFKENGTDGAITNVGQLEAMDCTFEDNGGNDGGAITNHDGHVNAIKCTFVKNSSSRGGAICNESHMVIDECIFHYNAGETIHNHGKLDIINNTTISESSKLIYNDGKLKIKKSTLLNSHVCAIENNGAAEIVDKSKIINNLSEDNVIKNRGTMEFEDSDISNNHSGNVICNENTLRIFDSTISGNGNLNSSHEIIANHGIVTISGCKIFKNKCLYNVIFSDDTLEIYNTDFESNECEQIVDNLDKLNVYGGTISGNCLEKSLICNSGTCAITKSKFEDNIFQIKDCITIYNTSQLILKGLYIKTGGKTIYNDEGGEIIIKESPKYLNDKIAGLGKVKGHVRLQDSFDFTFLDEEIHGSSSKEIKLKNDITFESGYEMDYYEGGVELDIDGLIIDGNGVTIDGDGKTRIFIVTGKNITLKNITFKNGFCHGDFFNSYNGYGDFMLINSDTEITIEDCRFINGPNESLYNKGDVKIDKSSFEKNNNAICNSGFGKMHAHGCEFNSNEIAISNYGEVEVEKTTFSNNEACISNHGEVELEKTTFSNNEACISNNNQMKIKESTITYNTNSIINNGVMKIIKTKFTSNIFHCINNKSELELLDCDFCRNKNDGLGGAAINNEGNLKITGGTFSENTTKGEGGAIYNKRDTTINGATFSSNRANGEWGGGAVFNYNGYVSLINCTFENNMSVDGKPIGDYNTHSYGSVTGINIIDCTLK